MPPLLYRHTGTAMDAKLKAITDTRTALLAGLIGVGALLTFWLNSRMYGITERTLKATEQGHITERYTKAIEQLGSDKLDVRLGGIYALEHIAVDSPSYHPTIVAVLSAFTRDHSPHPLDPGATSMKHISPAPSLMARSCRASTSTRWTWPAPSSAGRTCVRHGASRRGSWTLPGAMRGCSFRPGWGRPASWAAAPPASPGRSPMTG